MLGVVLWSDAEERKAVIWCEDHGDLAYLNGTDNVLNGEGFFDAGDLVQFEMCLEDSTRCACNPRLVMEKAATALPKALRRDRINTQNQSFERGRVIPFPPVPEPAEACA